MRINLLVGVLALVPVLSSSQTWHFEAPAGRPLVHVIRQLRQSRGWLISYEEGPYEGRNVGTDWEGLRGPTSEPVHFELDPFDEHSNGFEPLDQQLNLVHKLVTQANERLKVGTLREIADNPYIYVEPVLWSNDGVARPYKSLLDTPITLKEVSEYSNLAEIVGDILNQIAAARKVPISLGMLPNNVFYSRRALFDVKPAVNAKVALTDIFNQAFAEIPGKPDWGLCWELLYDANSKGFFFNVVSVARQDSDLRHPVTLSQQPIATKPAGGPKLYQVAPQ